MITTKKLLLFAGAWLAGFTPHVLAEYPGNTFSVTPDKVELEEGKSLVLMAQAGGAQKLFWTIKRDAEEKVVAVDTLTYNTVLYVINLGWSNDQVGVRALGSSRIDLTTLTGISLLGSSEKLTYNQDAGGLAIKVGKAPFESPAYAFKLTFSGQIPKLK